MFIMTERRRNTHNSRAIIDVRIREIKYCSSVHAMGEKRTNNKTVTIGKVNES